MKDVRVWGGEQGTPVLWPSPPHKICLLQGFPCPIPSWNATWKAGNLKPLYLFFGEEEFLMERAMRRLEAALAEAAGEACRGWCGRPRSESGGISRPGPHGHPVGRAQLLILRRVDTYPAEALNAVTDYLATRSPQPGRPHRPQSQGQGPGKARRVRASCRKTRPPWASSASETPTYFPGWPRRPGAWGRPCPRPRPSAWWRWWAQPFRAPPGTGKTGAVRRRRYHPDPAAGKPARHSQPHLQHLRPGGSPGGKGGAPPPGRPGPPFRTGGTPAPHPHHAGPAIAPPHPLQGTGAPVPPGRPG